MAEWDGLGRAAAVDTASALSLTCRITASPGSRSNSRRTSPERGHFYLGKGGHF